MATKYYRRVLLQAHLLYFHSKRRHFSSNSDTRRLILQHTVASRDHLTPEVNLHLITPECILWSSPGADCPFHDPFWAFYWPGGQALTRFLLDNPAVVRGRRILDVGSGCAASSIAAHISGAKEVVANDICPVAAVAMEMNGELNRTQLSIVTDNLIGSDCSNFDTVLFGDMFYDPVFANLVFKWIEKLRSRGKEVFIGDPGRLSFTNHPTSKALRKIASYELPLDCLRENNGMTEGCVWTFE